MNTKVTIEVRLDRSELALPLWADHFPAVNPPVKQKDQKDDDPAWIAILKDFEHRKGLCARGCSAALSQVSIAAKYCELMGMSIGIGDHCPMTLTRTIENASPKEILEAEDEMKKWIKATAVDSIHLWRKRRGFDYMLPELEALGEK